MNENTNAKTTAARENRQVPARCSVCGKQFLNIYPNTLPGMVFATCKNGHKTSYRTADLITRKAV